VNKGNKSVQWEDLSFILNLGSLVDYPRGFWSILKTL
jgi:hypothetical protein